MATTRTLIEFIEDDPHQVRAWLSTALADGRGDWMNLEPVIDDEAVDELAVRRGVAGWMSGRGSDLPYVTLVAPAQGRRPTKASLGLEHGAGPRSAAALTAAGVTPPPGWTLRQDHPRRGLVYESDGQVAVDETLDFVFRAVQHLCPVPLEGRWSAVAHRAG